MAAREWASLLAGLALASAGLTALAVSGPGEGPAVLPVTAAPAVVPATTTAAATTTADLPAAVAAVLAGNGPLEVIDPSAYGIPAEVARVLAERGVVLSVTADPAAALTPARGQ